MVEQELNFLREIEQSPTDEMPRLIYADWLEEHGDERADYLRLECELQRLRRMSPKFMELTEKLRSMREGFEPEWLLAIGRTRVGNCTAFSMECPNKWEWFVATEHPLVRFCDVCQKRVRYLSSIPDAERLAKDGSRVAIDSAMDSANLRAREVEFDADFVDSMIYGEMVVEDSAPVPTNESVVPRRPASMWRRILRRYSR